MSTPSQQAMRWDQHTVTTILVGVIASPDACLTTDEASWQGPRLEWVNFQPVQLGGVFREAPLPWRPTGLSKR